MGIEFNPIEIIPLENKRGSKKPPSCDIVGKRQKEIAVLSETVAYKNRLDLLDPISYASLLAEKGVPRPDIARSVSEYIVNRFGALASNVKFSFTISEQIPQPIPIERDL